MKSVLILEDDFELASEWRKALRDAGFEVEIALTSPEALGLAQSREFDLYVVDLLISTAGSDVRDSGRRFLRELVRDQPSQHVNKAAIGVTGFKPMNDEVTAQSVFRTYGVKHTLFKPFAAIELVEKAHAVIAEYEEFFSTSGP